MVIIDPSEGQTAVSNAERELHTALLGDPARVFSATDEADLLMPDADILNSRKPLGAAVNSTVLDYNLIDLDATAQHVQMPSQLHDHAVIKERRTNIVDVLKAALDRDPLRRDLRMKLLETYYSSAATNQRAFIEVVKKASCERDYLSTEDWQKVNTMGREIASGDDMFADQSKGDEFANCA
jgi:hypothetical protein